MNKFNYKSPWEAYPFLSEDPVDLRCDYELKTDKLASLCGLLRASILEADTIAKEEKDQLSDELTWVNNLIYDLNGSARRGNRITIEERDRLVNLVNEYQKDSKHHGFILPQGSMSAGFCHLLRCEAKELVRLTYHLINSQVQAEEATPVDNYGGEFYRLNDEDKKIMIDISSLLSGYFFALSLHLNKIEKTELQLHHSRHYEVESIKKEDVNE